MSPTFARLEELIGRLPVTQDNYWVFEKLLEQPYDIYRPIMDMLFDGSIVVEDLMIPVGGTSQRIADDSQAANRRLTAWDATSQAVAERCLELISSGARPGAVVVDRDTGSMSINPDGSVGPVYAPATATLVGADSDAISPNPIQLARAGTLAAAQKAFQERYAAALEPQIG